MALRILLLAVLAFASLHAAAAREPIMGGPCEGCEAVFDGLPQTLQSTARIAPEGEPGEALIIHGTVFDAAGKPSLSTIVYAYHTNKKGEYPPARAADGSRLRHGRLRGWARTDAEGRYRFLSIRPASYPNSDVPQHIHMHVIESGRGSYYIDDIVFEDDPLLNATALSRMTHGRGGSGVVSPIKYAEGVWLVRRDIWLGKNIPGY